jgi:non-ribosomal peptide synthase protein (TIGR01720 family)
VSATPQTLWFFEEKVIDPHHFNLALLLELWRPISASVLEQAVQWLWAQYDALRLKFIPGLSGWQPIVSDAEGKAPFVRFDLSGLAEEDQRQAIEKISLQMQSSLNLIQGPIARFCHFDLGSRRPGRLLLILHWLAADGLSQATLLEALHIALLQLQRGQPGQLPPRPMPFQRWAQQLAEYAQSTTVQQEQDYWLARPLHRICPFPVDDAQGANTSGSNRALFVSLSAQETQTLMHQVTVAYQAQMNEILLAALARVLTRWSGSFVLLVELVGHGRQAIAKNMDLARVVGRLAVHFPFLVDLETAPTLELAVKAVKEQLRGIPQGGIGYGLLRYQSRNPEIVRRLGAIPQSEIWFDYKGQMYQNLAESKLFMPAQESKGPERSPRQRRLFLLRVEGLIVQGRLQLEWAYSENVHRRSTVEALADQVLNELGSLCQ